MIDFKESFKNKNVLITGANGVLGSSCSKRLESLDANIFKLTRDISPIEDAKWLDMFADKNIDYIIHTASPTASDFYVNNPVETIDTNVLGSKNILEFAKLNNVTATVLLSTLEVYGKNDKDELSEADLGYLDPMQVRSSYPEAKRLMECYIKAYSSEYQVNCMSVRLAQTFGKEVNFSRENRVFMQFFRSALNSQDIKIATDGLSAQMYISTQDAVNAILTILLKGESGTAINVANEANFTTMKDMANLVANIVPKIVFEDKNEVIPVVNVLTNTDENAASKYPPSRSVYQKTDILKSLGFTPKDSLEDMYRELYYAYRCCE